MWEERWTQAAQKASSTSSGPTEYRSTGRLRVWAEAEPVDRRAAPSTAHAEASREVFMPLVMPRPRVRDDDGVGASFARRRRDRRSHQAQSLLALHRATARDVRRNLPWRACSTSALAKAEGASASPRSCSWSSPRTRSSRRHATRCCSQVPDRGPSASCTWPSQPGPCRGRRWPRATGERFGQRRALGAILADRRLGAGAPVPRADQPRDGNGHVRAQRHPRVDRRPAVLDARGDGAHRRAGKAALRAHLGGGHRRRRARPGHRQRSAHRPARQVAAPRVVVWLRRRHGRPEPRAGRPSAFPSRGRRRRVPLTASLRAFREQPFLARVALVVFLSTATFLALDYLFKSSVARTLPGSRRRDDSWRTTTSCSTSCPCSCNC